MPKTTLPKGKDTQEREFEQKLPVQLSSKEKEQKGVRLAQYLDEIETKNEAKKRISKQMKELGEKAAELREHLTSGVEKRDVKCHEVMDWKSKSVTVTRLDTGEVITERAMRQDELQIKMRLDEAAQKKAAKGKGEKDAPPAPPTKPEVKE